MTNPSPARIRVTVPGLVLIDCDVSTLVLHLLLLRPHQPCHLIDQTIAVETITAYGTQRDLIEPGDIDRLDL